MDFRVELSSTVISRSSTGVTIGRRPRESGGPAPPPSMPRVAQTTRAGAGAALQRASSDGGTDFLAMPLGACGAPPGGGAASWRDGVGRGAFTLLMARALGRPTAGRGLPHAERRHGRRGRCGHRRRGARPGVVARHDRCAQGGCRGGGYESDRAAVNESIREFVTAGFGGGADAGDHDAVMARLSREVTTLAFVGNS